ncbi:MAG: DNA polymerase III subunit delta [Bulleidia sp.]
MNLYLFEGTDLYRQESALKTLLKKHDIPDNRVVVIDASDKKSFRMDRVLMECDMMSLFDEGKKAVIVRNPFFLSADQKEGGKSGKNDTPAAKKRLEAENRTKEERAQQLTRYLREPNRDTLLIFQCHGYKADSRKSDYKLLTAHGCEVITNNEMEEEEFQGYVSRQLKTKGFVLDQDAMRLLLERTGTKTILFQNALLRFELYGKKNLDFQDVRHLVPLNPDINVFNLTSGFTSGNLGLALDTKEEMCNAGYDTMALISMLGKRLRVMYNVRRLSEQGLNNEMIASRLHQKKGYVYYVLKDSSRFTSAKILRLLNELAELDQGIKQGIMNPEVGFEQFLIRNGK